MLRAFPDDSGECRLYRLEEETEADWWEVEALYDLCFSPGRTALSSYRLRDGVATVAALCLVVRDDDGSLAAAIRHWPVEVGGRMRCCWGRSPFTRPGTARVSAAC